MVPRGQTNALAVMARASVRAVDVAKCMVVLLYYFFSCSKSSAGFQTSFLLFELLV
jgi:hypothetical protein